MNLNTPITTEECSNKITITITDFVVSAGTINIFKNRLDKFWSDQDIRMTTKQISMASGTVVLYISYFYVL